MRCMIDLDGHLPFEGRYDIINNPFEYTGMTDSSHPICRSNLQSN